MMRSGFLALALLLAATVTVVVAARVEQVPGRVWSRAGVKDPGPPRDGPDGRRIPVFSYALPQGSDGYAFTLVPWYGRLRPLSVVTPREIEVEWVDCEATGREVALPSGRWREYTAVPAWKKQKH